jgi:hypothetical protein
MAREEHEVNVDDIPVAFTPPGGYGDDFPAPVLSACTDELAPGAPDIRGLWQITEVSVGDQPDAEHAMIGAVQRIEQCADRVVITGSGIIHDMRADGTEANGVHDVAAADFTSPVHVVATFEDGVHVLRPIGVPIEVTRHRDGADLTWCYIGYTARLIRLGPPEMEPPHD